MLEFNYITSLDGTGWVVGPEGGPCDHDEGPDGEQTCDCAVHAETCPCSTCDIFRSIEQGVLDEVDAWVEERESLQVARWAELDKARADYLNGGWIEAHNAALVEHGSHDSMDALLDDMYKGWGYPEELRRRLLNPEDFPPHPHEAANRAAIEARSRDAVNREIAKYEDGVDYIKRAPDAPLPHPEYVDEELEALLLEAQASPQARLKAAEDAFAQYVTPVTPRDDAKVKEPALVERTDGATILYASRFSTLFGEPGLGKSFVALMMAVDAMRTANASVLWLDFEDTAQLLADRAATIGALADVQDARRFKFLQVDIGDDLDALDAARQWANLQPHTLVVVDSAEAAGCPSDGADVMPWLRHNIDPWIAAGCAVLLVDHVPKNKENRPRGGIGSNRKLAHLSGAALYLTGIPMTPTTNGRA